MEKKTLTIEGIEVKKLTIEGIEVKKLTINKVDYAFYKIEGDRLFLKVIYKLEDVNEMAIEDEITEIISFIENIRFSFLGYLNIK